jgi:opacity protein-like surface antigen
MTMKHKRVCLLALILLHGATCAGTIGGDAWSRTGYYIGLGGSYNWDRINAHSAATLHATSGLPPLGTFTGTTGDYTHFGDGLGAQASVGYLHQLSVRSWLWGLELMYQYAQTKATANSLNKDSGSSIDLIDPAMNVTDLITLAHVQTKVTDSLLLPAFLGHTYSHGFLYLGAGPALLRAQRNVSDSSDTNSGYYIGTIPRLTNTKWMWGGAVHAGLTYDLNSSWFLKLNYTYALTNHYTLDNSAAYSSANNGGLNKGGFLFNTHQRINTQTAAISMNKLFL